jgi:hypothetical protein
MWRSGRLRRAPDAPERKTVPMLYGGDHEVISNPDRKIATP